MKTAAAAMMLAGLLCAGPSAAQTTAPAPGAEAAAPAKPTRTQKVKAYTRKEWNAMKRRWAKQRERWAYCRAQNWEKNLKGHESNAFLEECMTR
jgi:hypothetical protein